MTTILPIIGLILMMATSYALAWCFSRSQPVANQAARTGCLDGLRGYLALSVVAHHFLRVWNDARSGSMVAPDGNIVFQNLGPTAVMLFFMITAFLFYSKIVAARGTLDWRALYTSRFFRLIPAYWIVLAVMLILLMVLQDWKLQVSPSRFLSEVARWMLFTLPGGPPINGYRETGSLLAGVIWTLRYEWLFYLLLPVLALVVWHLGRTQILRLGMLVVGALVTAFGPAIVVFHFSSAFALPFLLGMIAAELNGIRSLRSFARDWRGTLAGLACLGLLLTCAPDESLTWRAPFLIVFFLTVVAGNSYFGLLARRPSILLGDASYSIYLLHGLALNAMPLVFGATIYADAQGLTGWLLLPPIAATIVVLAILNYRLVEAPFIRMGRDVLRARREAPVLAKIAP
ncbi:acyltransferase family protein [Lichenifustis flavocetrariae]|uniref:Acyltransferase n=1 Tax=Lichenifustis flavocetrariae TaxID=2949735 RepID=A0AA42CMN3_9HYPH|nr:acyltransferase [Lichenifustis flavocetrariae]MCW6508567.1 acyltransferase [Lichenifustis flavocetrariae]